MRLDSRLVKKYNVPGPRYTSYPTVPYWEGTPSPEQWLDSVAHALNERHNQAGAAIYMHIPFCQTLCTYCGCNTRITRNLERGHEYVGTILKEWELYKKEMKLRNSQIRISEIHLGGGTPTFLSPKDLKNLVDGIIGEITITTSHEFSVEADPRVTNDEHLRALAELGFRRLSLGVQDFDLTVQEAVHRVQTVEQVRRVTESARRLGFESINYDLIYGLPFQTETSVRNTIQEVMDLHPDRIAFYGYAHVPWIRAGQRRFTEADLPSGEAKLALYELGREMLESAGYQDIGMDHFALETDSLWKAKLQGELHRNFMGYTSQKVMPLIGLGVSAIGDSWGFFAQNDKTLEAYIASVEKGNIPIFRGHVLDTEDLILRRHILKLMTCYQTDWSKESDHTPYLEAISSRLSELISDGLVELRGRSCKITEQGKPFLRNICMVFDARLTRKSPTAPLFSKTI